MKHHHGRCCGSKKHHNEMMEWLEEMNHHGHRRHRHHHHGHHDFHMKEKMGLMMLEKQATRIPSRKYMCAAIGSMAASLTLKCTGHKHTALFIGQWAAPLLILGLYNKMKEKH